MTSDELVTSNIYETGLEATNPIFGLPPKDDKGAAGNQKILFHSHAVGIDFISRNFQNITDVNLRP